MSSGDRVPDQQAYSDEELLDLLRDAAGKVDGVLTQPVFLRMDGYPDITAYERRFGSWNAAKERAGLETIDGPYHPG